MPADEHEPPVFGPLEPGWSYIPRPGAYAVAPDAAGRLLCILVPTGLYLPGGGIEEGETAEAAVLRELFEETGFEGRVVSPLGRADQRVVARNEQAAFLKQCTFHLVDLGRARDAATEHEFTWVSPRDAVRRLVDEAQVWAVERYLARPA